MVSRRDRIYREWIDPVDTLDLDPEHGYLSVIVPEATTNLCTNPSFEYGATTGWATLNTAAAGITYNWQAHGSAGYSLTPLDGVTETTALYGPVSMASGTTYTASVTIQGKAGLPYYIKIETAGGAVLASRKWIATGLKQRIWITYTETATNDRYVSITKGTFTNDTSVWYLDGLQIEAKAYPTTYCDGDQIGFTLDELEFWWNGAPGASTSSRSAQTRAGGREMNLLSYGFRLIAILGLGLSALVDQSLEIPGLGALPQGTGTTVRDFTVLGQMEGDTPRHLMAQRAGLIDVFKPDVTVSPQELILRYQHCDEDGNPDSQSVDIICKYQSGMEGTGAQLQERLALGFRQYVPFIKSTFSSGVQLGYNTQITGVNNIMLRGVDGTWEKLGDGANDSIYAMAISPNGELYVGGAFTSCGGVANTNKLAKWTGSAWAAVTTASIDDIIQTIAFDAAGNLYVGGAFVNLNGTGIKWIAKFNGLNWTALGPAGNNGVYSIAIDQSGKVYAGGDFTQIGGVSANRIAVWDGSHWAAMGAGANGSVGAIKIGTDGKIYAGGTFSSMSGIAHTGGIARWDGATWSALGYGLVGYPGQGVYTLAFTPDGTLYAGGNFYKIGNRDTGGGRLAKFTGSGWYPVQDPVGSDLDTIYYIHFNAFDGQLYIVGTPLTFGTLTLPQGTVTWSGSSYVPMDIKTDGLPQRFVTNQTGLLYMSAIGINSTAYSATVTAPDIGSASAYPIIRFIGPGTLYQLKNYTTGKAIYFNYTLLAGETAVLNLDPQNPSFVSSFNGDIWTAILPGSDTDFMLAPGANNISTYLYGGTTAASKIVMYWQGLYWALDEAILK